MGDDVVGMSNTDYSKYCIENYEALGWTQSEGLTIAAVLSITPDEKETATIIDEEGIEEDAIFDLVKIKRTILSLIRAGVVP